MTVSTRAAARRVLDLAIAAPLALVTLPVLAALLVAAAVAYRANPLFTQLRLGLDGELFRFVKVRSLPPSAPVAAPKHEVEALRSTGFGGFVRKYHLDELPQLWLVIGGSMSLVGPRPEMPELAATFDPVFVKERTTVKPGCTGLWQVSADSANLIGDAPQWDRVYVHHATARLDLWILWYTVREILGAESLTSVDQLPRWTGVPRSGAADSFA